MENEGFAIDHISPASLNNNNSSSNETHRPLHKHSRNISNYETYFNRQELNAKDIEKKYAISTYKSNNIFNDTKNYMIKYYKPSRGCMKNYLFDRIPFLRWILSYDVKENLVKDIIAGLTIGVIQIPQGMAYSLMAGMPPVIGLYVSFWAVIVYSFLGTARHLSTGTYAITSLMINSCLQKLEGKYFSADSMVSRNFTGEMNRNYTTNPNYLSDDPTEAKIMIGTALAFYTGIIQVIFAILHVGIVTKYLSDMIISAFTIGASFHIVVTQITTLLGLKKIALTTPFAITEEIIEIISHIAKTNLATLIISIVSMIFIFSIKHFINEKYKEKMFAPIPVDLIVVILGTVISYVFKFKEKWHVKTVGEIPLGFPKPFAPPFYILPDIIDSAINISIVSFAINVSMAKLFAKKYKYDIDANQELFSYGMGNLFCSFFSGFPSCVGLSRSVILDSVGAKTQIFGLLSSIVVMIVILAVGPLFKTLPNACLASIIVVALLKMMFEVRVIKSIYQKSKFEALAWIITFGAVVILDIDFGLYIGIAFSLLLIIVQSQRASASVLGNIPYTDIYESIDICEDAKEFDSIKIVRYESSVFYANVENFSYKITKLSGVNATEISQRINKLKFDHEKIANKSKPSKLKNLLQKKGSKNQEVAITNHELERLKHELNEKIEDIKANVPVTDIILDFSCINYIDSMGINALVQMNEMYKEVGINLHLAYCKSCIFRSFKKNSFDQKFDYSHIYPTIHDAVMSILRKNKLNIRLISRRKSSININVIESQERGEHGFAPVYKPRSFSKPNIFDEITIKSDLETIQE